MENYGHYAEITLIGEKLLHTVGKTCRFRSQWDPFTAEPDEVANVRADYGPTILSVLEYISRAYGIHIDRERVLWSGLPRGKHAVDYKQQWGDRTYALRIADGQMIGSLIDTDSVNDSRSAANAAVPAGFAGSLTADRFIGKAGRNGGRELFRATAGVRVVTDVTGNVQQIVGIAPQSQAVVLQVGSQTHRLEVAPNAVWAVGATGAPTLIKKVPFDFPYHQP